MNNESFNEEEFLNSNNIFDDLFLKLIPQLKLVELLPYLIFKVKTKDKNIKRRLVIETLKNKNIDNHEKYLEKSFDDCNRFYAIDVNFWDALVDENKEIPDYINNSRIAEEIKLIREEEKFYQEENEELRKEQMEKIAKNNKKEKKSKKGKDNKNKENKENKENKKGKNKDKEEENKKEEDKDKDTKKEENDLEQDKINKIVTKSAKLKKGLKYKEDFIILCDELYNILNNNYKIDYEIKLKKSKHLYLITNKPKKEEKQEQKEGDNNIKQEQNEEEKKIEENQEKKDEIKEEEKIKNEDEDEEKNKEKDEEEFKKKEKFVQENLNVFNLDIEKGVITKIIKDKNDNYIQEVIDFYPIQLYQTLFGQILRAVEKAKITYDDIEEKKRIKKLPKNQQKKINKKKAVDEAKLIQRMKKYNGLKQHYQIEYYKKIISEEEYQVKKKELENKYSDVYEKVEKKEKTHNTYETDITLTEFKENLQKYKNNLLLEKTDNILTLSRFRTHKEIIEEMLMLNPGLKSMKYDIYYYLFNSNQLIKQEDDQLLGKEENEDFILLLIDLHDDKDMNFYQLLQDKGQANNIELNQTNDDNDEILRKVDKSKDKEKKRDKSKDKDKENINDKKKEKMTKEEKEKLEKEKKEKKEKEKELKRIKKEEEKRIAQLKKDMKEKEKEENKKRKQIEKEKERELEKKKEREKYIAPPYGINNYGNTCYFNSVNQIFFNMPILQQIFLDPRIDYFINKTNKFGHQGKFFEKYKSLYWIKPSKVGDVVQSLKSLVGKLKEDFNNYDQQDANEYLNFVIENLHEELNLHSEKIYIEEKDDILHHNTDEELGNISWANNLRRNASFIDSIFMFQFKSDLKCRRCNTKKINFETNYIFDLPLSLCKMVNVEVYLYRLPFRYKLYYNKINEKFDKYIQEKENKKLSIVKNLWNYYTNVLTIEEKKEHYIQLHFSFDLERDKNMSDITKILRGIKPLELEPEKIIETLNNEKVKEYKIEHYTDLITYSNEKNRIIRPNSSIDKYVNINDNIKLNIYEVLNTNGMRLLFEEENKNTIL